MDDTLSAALAAELRAERAVQKMAVRELAKRSHLVERSVHRWLKGERDITLEVLTALADALNIPASELMRRAEIRAGKMPPNGGGGEVIDFPRR